MPLDFSFLTEFASTGTVFSSNFASHVGRLFPSQGICSTTIGPVSIRSTAASDRYLRDKQLMEIRKRASDIFERQRLRLEQARCIGGLQFLSHF